MQVSRWAIATPRPRQLAQAASDWERDGFVLEAAALAKFDQDDYLPLNVWFVP
jgi:hypothetical protein